MSDIDALEQAKDNLKAAGSIIQKEAQKSPTILAGDYAWTAEQCMQAVQAAALIAQVERMDKQNEQLLYIRGYLHDLLAVFQNAEGPDGAIKVAQ